MSSFAYRVSGFNRKRKWSLFESMIRPAPELTVLDVGFNDEEHSSTDNYIEKHYPWRSRITALGIDAPIEFPKRYPDVRAVQYDGTTFPFDDAAFDVCWSNAVLEHVGMSATRHDAQVYFLREIARVSRTAFVTTPNRWFPVEVHTRTPFLHWLPKRWFDRYLRKRKQYWATGDYMDLLSKRDLRRLLAEAGIRDYRIIENKLMGLTLDFVVVWGERTGRA